MRSRIWQAIVAGLMVGGVLLLPGVAIALPLVAEPQAAMDQALTQYTSSNWAGYIDSAGVGTVTKVSASWTEPAVKCTTGNQFAVFWVGIDGAFAPSTTVEQTGTLAQCTGSVASYSAWWELYPLNAIQVIPSIKVHPGDMITTSVTFASGQFTMTIKDGAQSFSKKGTQSGVERNSAECVTERPATVSGGTVTLLPLANFGSVGFTNCKATISGKSGAIGSFGGVGEITMVNKQSKVLALPSALDSTKAGFSVFWKASH